MIPVKSANQLAGLTHVNLGHATMRRMSRDAHWVLALLAAALVATAVVGVRIVRQVKDLVATAQRASSAGDGPFLYAPVDRAPAAPPARFAARLPRLDEFARRGE